MQRYVFVGRLLYKDNILVTVFVSGDSLLGARCGLLAMEKLRFIKTHYLLLQTA